MANPTLVSFLVAHPEIFFVHFHVVTLSGTLAGRCLPRAGCLALSASDESALHVSIFTLIGLCPWTALPNKSVSGSDCLVPDWSSLRILDGGDEASVICNVSEEFSGHPDVIPNQPFLRCPRNTLQETVSILDRDQPDVGILAGFEIEFYLVSAATATNPATVSASQASYGNFARPPERVSSLRGEEAACVRECVIRLQAAGVQVQHFHTCTGPSQYEISTGPLPVVAAVDALVQSLEIIRRVAVRRGYRAIFLPQPFEGGIETCGLHMHLSINPVVPNQVPDDRGDFFLAGMVQRLPLLCALGMPHEMSYGRVAPIAAGEWVCWGHENRDAPIRALGRMHWEFRALDATANVYLAAAGCLAAGLLGLQQRLKLPTADTRESLGSLTDEERKERGITTAMPRSLGESLDALKSDSTYRDGLDLILGSQILDYYGHVKHGEKELLENMEPDDRLAMYLELF